MTTDDDYFDSFFEETFPWREYSPEEFAARHWLEFGACSIAHNNRFRDPDMHKWAIRFEEIFHSRELIEQCRKRYLTADERAFQDAKLRKIDKHGL